MSAHLPRCARPTRLPPLHMIRLLNLQQTQLQEQQRLLERLATDLRSQRGGLGSGAKTTPSKASVSFK